MELNVWRVGEDLGGAEGGETMMKIYENKF